MSTHCLHVNTHCCHSIFQQHRPPAPSVATTQLSHWTILCCSNVTPCVLKNLLSFSIFPLSEPYLGGTKK